MASRTTVDALELRISASATDAAAGIGVLITNLKALKEATAGVPESLRAIADALKDVKGVAKGGVGLADVVKELAGYNRVMAQAIRYANKQDQVFGSDGTTEAQVEGLQEMVEAGTEAGKVIEEVRDYEAELAEARKKMAVEAEKVAKQQERQDREARRAAKQRMQFFTNASKYESGGSVRDPHPVWNPLLASLSPSSEMDSEASFRLMSAPTVGLPLPISLLAHSALVTHAIP